MIDPVAMIHKILESDLAAVDGNPMWWRWADWFCGELAAEVVSIAGADPGFEAEMYMMASIREQDRAAVVHSQLERFVPHQHAHLSDVLRKRVIKAFVADLELAWPDMAERLGADFARQLNGFNRLHMLFDCLHEYRLLAREPTGYCWERDSFGALLNMIDPAQEIQWLLKLTWASPSTALD